MAQAAAPQVQDAKWKTQPTRQEGAAWSLEDLAFHYGTDKAHDDHKYVDVYESLFHSIRFTARNVTEIGIALGQSLQMWHDYFVNADLWGVDIHPLVIMGAKKIFKDRPRVHVLQANSRATNKVPALGLEPESMDVILDDGDHWPPAMERTLLTWWRYLKPGGYYLIEDVATGASPNGQTFKRGPDGFPPGYAPMIHNGSFMSEAALEIFYAHDSYFVDCLVGHRAYARLLKHSRCCMRDRVNHNSHILVLRKREKPRERMVQSNTGGKAAMSFKGLKAMLTPAQLAEDPKELLGSIGGGAPKKAKGGSVY